MDAWELGKIGRYYAVEDMLTTAEAERYGAMSLREHYENVAKNGQEYDPYTTVFAKNPLIKYRPSWLSGTTPLPSR